MKGESNINFKYFKNQPELIHQIPLFENVTDYMKFVVKTSPYNVALKIRRNNKLEIYTWKQYKDNIYKCAKSLLKLKLTENCSININSYNTPEWFFIFFASIFTKYLPTGIYTTNSSKQCEFCFNITNAEVVFVEDEERLKNYIEIKDNIPKCKAIIIMEIKNKNNILKNEFSNLPFKIYEWNEFLQLGIDIDDKEIDEISSSIKPNDNMTLIFTSGTSSSPKVCLLTHKNYISTAYNSIQLFFKKVVFGKEVFISYLPASHVTDQISSIIVSLITQSITVFGDRNALRGSLLNTLKEFKPTIFVGVPRVYEKMHFKIESEIKKMNGIKRYLAEWGLKVGFKNANKIEKGEKPSYEYNIAYNLVIKNILENIGLINANLCVSGSAPLSIKTIEFFRSLGIFICNVYGLSETCGPTFIELPILKPGSVGKLCFGEMMIANDDEILLKGDYLFKCYYNDEELTKEAFNEEGWYLTGDLGKLDSDGYLYITDRKKDIIITAGGENIAPSMIEGKLRNIPGVEQAVVYGDKQKFLVCLIIINLEYFNTNLNLNYKNLDEASNDHNINKYIQDSINEINQDLARVQTIKRFKILPNEFSESTEDSEITATKKLRRKIVYQKYKNEFKQLYGDLYFE